ncbi:hypothetical protein LCGC14_0282400 [marine sediment metagenome]|uniref:Uncharacterized protein n=1 Tax=marine sediment metagenome TaxID=412755 RepID=A0A0F9WGP5_9ZZZZ
MGSNLQFLRGYFEAGCLCILSHGTLARAPDDMSDEMAADLYMANCRCSRHPNYPQNILGAVQ